MAGISLGHVVTIGKLRNEVKASGWKKAENCATIRPVPRRETFDDLLTKQMPPGESWEDFAARAGVTSRAIRILRDRGGKRPFRGTVAKLATALGVPPARVRAAIEASREAAE